jgi:hypothetical protein
MSDIKNWKEERLILVHSFRGFSPQLLGLMCIGRTSWWQEPVAETAYLMVEGNKEKGKGPGTRYNLQRNIPSDLLPPSWPYLLRFSKPPKIALPA